MVRGRPRKKVRGKIEPPGTKLTGVRPTHHVFTPIIIMASSIVNYSSLDIKKIKIGELKTGAKGGKSVGVTYGTTGRYLKMELPSMQIPAFGVSFYDKAGQEKKWSVPLSFGGHEDFQKIAEALDEYAIALGMANAAAWFGKPGASRDVIEDKYTRLVKYSMEADKITRKPYPPTFKVNLRAKGTKDKKGEFHDLNDPLSLFEINLYDGTVLDAKGQPTAFDKSLPITSVLTPRSYLTPIAECSSIWIVSGKFGWTWNGFQGRIEAKEDAITGPAFSSSVSTKFSKMAVAGGGAGTYEDEVSVPPAGGYGASSSSAHLPMEDDEHEEDDAPKFSAPAAAPAPPAEEEEEPIPIPAPKKTAVVKKAVVKAKA
jgi:hypothetical protein